MLLIGINGRLRSGKDTAYEIIDDVLGGHHDHALSVERFAFADKLKLSAVLALGFDPAGIDEAVAIADAIKVSGTIDTSYDGSPSGPIREGRHISGREFLQRYGTEAHRNVFDDEFWVNALLPEPSGHPSRDNREADNAFALRKRFPGTDVAVITDVRFPNEAMRVMRLGGQVWKIDAEQRLGPLPADAHASEHPLPDSLVTHVVPNNGTLDEFRRNIREVLA